MDNSHDPAARRSLFISYSRQDKEIARRVQDALAAQGIHAWFDQIDIQPGTPDFDDAIREAIKQSQALILIASPHSRASLNVRDELNIARRHQRPVYPLWVLG